MQMLIRRKASLQTAVGSSKTVIRDINGIRSWLDSRDLLHVLGLSSWAVSSILVQGSVRASRRDSSYRAPRL
jgi:hypothetical protein